jgi:hypothetical protein
MHLKQNNKDKGFELTQERIRTIALDNIGLQV